MPRRNQEAEDEAYAQALQDEYRKDFIRRQAEKNQRRANHASESIADLPRRKPSKAREDYFTNANTTNTNANTNTNTQRKARHKSRSRSRDRSQTNHTSSSSSEKPKRERRKSSQRQRRSKNGPRRTSSTGSEWLAIHHDNTGQHELQEQQQQQPNRSLSMPTQTSSLPPPFVPATMDTDEEFARMVQHELELERMEEEARAEQARRFQDTYRDTNVVVRGTPINRNYSFLDRNKTTRSNSNSSSNSTEPLTDMDNDEVIARRIQQELQDAEYAQRISLQEQEERATRGVLDEEYARRIQEPPQRSCFARWWSTVACLAICIAIPLLFVFDVIDFSRLPIFGFGDEWVGSDPFSGMNMTINNVNGTLVPRLPPNAYGWSANKDGGLELDILNACSDDYLPFVQTAIRNWEEGSPIDSLTLFETRVPYEKDCEPENNMGKLKICNGDYGDTRWRGLNEVLIRQNVIVASGASLNQFYLDFESDAQKLYTSCHELGHGFGLPHWDEDFFNEDLGNCMDYTQRPDLSTKPDASNFLYLAQLYGGREEVTKELITANDAQTMVLAYQTDENENNSMGVRQLRRRRNLAKEQQPQPQGYIPFAESRLLLDTDGYLPSERNHPTKKVHNRRILQATDDFEIHAEQSSLDPDILIIKHYLLVKE